MTPEDVTVMTLAAIAVLFFIWVVAIWIGTVQNRSTISACAMIDAETEEDVKMVLKTTYMCKGCKDYFPCTVTTYGLIQAEPTFCPFSRAAQAGWEEITCQKR